MRRTKPQSVSADYIVGLTDGEGCFYVLLNKSPKYRTGYGVHLHFHIKMQQADQEVLIKVRNALDCGEVYFQNEKRLNHVHCYRYTVAAHRDIIEKIVPFFQRYSLQTVSKKKNFELFSQIAKIVGRGEHLNINGINRIIKLKAKMNQRTVDSRSAGNPLATSKAVK